MSEPLERFWVQIPFKFPTIQNFIGVIIVLYFQTTRWSSTSTYSA